MAHEPALERRHIAARTDADRHEGRHKGFEHQPCLRCMMRTCVMSFTTMLDGPIYNRRSVETVICENIKYRRSHLARQARLPEAVDILLTPGLPTVRHDRRHIGQRELSRAGRMIRLQSTFKVMLVRVHGPVFM
jgi:hypothetical protein